MVRARDLLSGRRNSMHPRPENCWALSAARFALWALGATRRPESEAPPESERSERPQYQLIFTCTGPFSVTAMLPPSGTQPS